MTAGRPVNAQVPVGCSGRRRLAGISRTSVRSFVKPRPDNTCSNDTPALQPPATTAPVRAVPCWQDTTIVLRGGAMRVRLRIENVLLQAGTRMRVYVHGATTGAILIPLPAFTLPALDLCLWPALSRTRPIRYRC